MRQVPQGYRNSPIWEAFELWANEHYIDEASDDWQPWWECFLAGVEIGMAEAA